MLEASQSIMVGDDIELKVTVVKSERILIGVDAPKPVPVFRIDEVKRLDRPEQDA